PRERRRDADPSRRAIPRPAARDPPPQTAICRRRGTLRRAGARARFSLSSLARLRFATSSSQVRRNPDHIAVTGHEDEDYGILVKLRYFPSNFF
ncbi:hypothetical protein, partial [Burkholderia glumae]|uniref:hypothetical protein n=1 Tax=Burkholderia glumae TaxID=337 RepID=UPI0019D6C4B3